MSVFDINPGNTSSAITMTGETGSVINQDLHQEGSSTGLVNNNTAVVKTDDNTKTIVLDGPLSEIYTRALNIVYGNNAEPDTSNVSQETQQMDSVLVADVHNYNKNKEAENKDNVDSAYVYVTDAKLLNIDELPETYDNIRVALDSKQFNKSVVCIESDGNSNNRNVELISQLARDFGARVFYNRDSTMRYLNGLYHA